MKPWRWLIFGIFAAGIKYPIDRLRGKETERYTYLKSVKWGLTFPDANVVDALSRCDTNSNKRGLSHNATNLYIELARAWCVYEAWRLNDIAMHGEGEDNMINVLPGLLKALASFWSYTLILLTIAIGVGVWLGW